VSVVGVSGVGGVSGGARLGAGCGPAGVGRLEARAACGMSGSGLRCVCRLGSRCGVGTGSAIGGRSGVGRGGRRFGSVLRGSGDVLPGLSTGCGGDVLPVWGGGGCGGVRGGRLLVGTGRRLLLVDLGGRRGVDDRGGCGGDVRAVWGGGGGGGVGGGRLLVGTGRRLLLVDLGGRRGVDDRCGAEGRFAFRGLGGRLGDVIRRSLGLGRLSLQRIGAVRLLILRVLGGVLTHSNYATGVALALTARRPPSMRRVFPTGSDRAHSKLHRKASRTAAA